MTRTILPILILMASAWGGGIDTSLFVSSGKLLTLTKPAMNNFVFGGGVSIGSPTLTIRYAYTDSVRFEITSIGRDILHPGDCLTLDRNYALIRCPDFPPRMLPDSGGFWVAPKFKAGR